MSECKHERVRLVQDGGYHFSAGEVWDDIVDRYICEDCGEIFNLEEVDIEQEENAEIKELPF